MHELYVAHQALLSMGFSRQEYWNGWPVEGKISFSRRSSQPRDWTCISCIDRQVLYHLSHEGGSIEPNNERLCVPEPGTELWAHGEEEGSKNFKNQKWRWTHTHVWWITDSWGCLTDRMVAVVQEKGNVSSNKGREGIDMRASGGHSWIWASTAFGGGWWRV